MLNLPANRVAAIVTFLTSLATALTSAAGAWGDDEVTKSIGIGVGIIGAIVTTLKFLDGSQKWESYIADGTKDVNPDGSTGNLWHPKDDPFATPAEGDGDPADFEFPETPPDS